MRSSLRVAAAALLSMVAACGGGGTEPPSPQPTNLVITTAPSPTGSPNGSGGVFAVKVTDASGVPMSGRTVSFTATNGTTVSPASATTDANGIAQTTVTLGPTAGTSSVTATVTGTSLTTSANITIQVATCSQNVGEIVTYSGVATACLTGAAAGSDFTLIAYNSTTAGDSPLTATITGTGLGTAPTSSQIASDPTWSLQPLGVSASVLVPDDGFHMRMLEKSRRLMTLERMQGARAWQEERRVQRAASASGGFAPELSPSTIPAGLAVGAIVTVNVNANEGCSNPIFRGARVVAVGTKALVLNDTLNPAGGFSSADFTRIAANFDTLVYPLDTATFGAPTDIDNNGKIAILFTRAVNELTPANNSSFVGGFFYSRDFLALNGSARTGPACPGSNEGEIFYMLAPDPNGAVNNNIRRTGFVDSLVSSTLAHEFQHLINAGRRIYINTAATSLETRWLNEGLSHIAEELLYYRESKMSPRQNLTDAAIRVNSPSTYPFWKMDQSQNFSRYASYLRNPGQNSPIGSDDSLATRGASWAFLRYTVDQVRSADGDFWYRLVNNTSTSLANLSEVLGTDPGIYLRDWAIANYFDDLTVLADPRYQQKSWNYRDVYTKTFVAATFPLKLTPLVNNTAAPVSVRGSSSSYYRLSVPASGSASLKFDASGVAPPSSLQFILVRTR